MLTMSAGKAPFSTATILLEERKLERKHGSLDESKFKRNPHEGVQLISINPFTPESDQCQISPAASASILHRIVWRT